MRAIFTVCTYNHIARAFSLAESVQKHSPNTRFIIGIIGQVDVNTILSDYEIVRADEMGIPFLKEMYIKYSALELNSALKPYFANYILDRFTELNNLIFLDSDILLFTDLDPVYESLQTNSVVITPHSLSSVDEGNDFDDRVFLRSGIYNAGFFGVKRDDYSKAFLVWWMNKLKDQCFFDSKKGMFAEQLWMNLIPLYLEKVDVLKHLGCNVSYWNLHERRITQNNGNYYVNGDLPLVFYHYSGASMDCFEKNSLSDHQRRYTFTNRPEMVGIFRLYIDLLKKYSFEQYREYYTINNSFKTRYKVVKYPLEFIRRIAKKLFYRR